MSSLGKALTVIAMQRACEEIMHADVDAFYAPSECHGLVSRGELTRERYARRHARSIAGGDVRKLAIKRIGLRALTRAMYRLDGILHEKYNPF